MELSTHNKASSTGYSMQRPVQIQKRHRSAHHEAAEDSKDPLLDQYVQKWLAGTTEKAKGQPDSGQSSKEKAKHFDDVGQDRRVSRLNSRLNKRNLDDAPLRDENQYNHRERHLAALSDDSVLDFAPPPTTLHSQDGMNLDHKAFENVQITQNGFHHSCDANEPVSKEPKLGESFEKRKRRKTRDDRYDPHKQSKKGVSHERRQGERSKKGNGKHRRTVSKKNEEDILQNFSSRSIGSDRLTIRPAQTLGLFNKGRASSSAMRRGLPDLAFSEMEFLRPSDHTTQDVKNKSVSKWREKEQRKSSRAQNEVSSYFVSNTSALSYGQDQIDHNEDKHASEIANGNSAHEKASMLRDSNDPLLNVYSVSTNSASHSPHRNYASTESLRPNPHIYGKDPRARNSPQLLNRLPDLTTSNCTWSDTVDRRSRSIDENAVSSAKQQNGSLTPDIVRQSLEDTGIYRYSGIQRRPRKSSPAPSLNSVAEASERARESTDASIARDLDSAEIQTGMNNRQDITDDPGSNSAKIDRSSRQKSARDLYITVRPSLPKYANSMTEGLNPSDELPSLEKQPKLSNHKEIGTQTSSSHSPVDILSSPVQTTSPKNQEGVGANKVSKKDDDNPMSVNVSLISNEEPLSGVLVGRQNSAEDIQMSIPQLRTYTGHVGFQNLVDPLVDNERRGYRNWPAKIDHITSDTGVLHHSVPVLSLYSRQLGIDEVSQIPHLEYGPPLAGLELQSLGHQYCNLETSPNHFIWENNFRFTSLEEAVANNDDQRGLDGHGDFKEDSLESDMYELFSEQVDSQYAAREELHRDDAEIVQPTNQRKLLQHDSDNMNVSQGFLENDETYHEIVELQGFWRPFVQY